MKGGGGGLDGQIIQENKSGGGVSLQVNLSVLGHQTILAHDPPRALTIFLDLKIARCQLLGPDPGGVWESTHKFSANLFSCVFAL